MLPRWLAVDAARRQGVCGKVRRIRAASAQNLGSGAGGRYTRVTKARCASEMGSSSSLSSSSFVAIVDQVLSIVVGRGEGHLFVLRR